MVLRAPLSKDSETSWEKAKEVAANLGTPHRLFVQAVRDLRGIGATGSRKKMLESSSVITLFRSESFRTVIYFAAKAIYGEDIGAKPLNGGQLITTFSPDDLASVIAVTHLHRKTSKNVLPKIWQEVALEVNLQMQTGIHVGSEVESIGRPVGILVGAVRYLALAIIASTNESLYRTFRRQLIADDKLFNTRSELQTWGCHHLQVAALLIQSMGYGIPPALGICADSMPDAEAGEMAQQWYAARRWIETMLEEEKMPREFGSGSPYTLSDLTKMARLQRHVDELYSKESSIAWINMRRGSLDETVATQLRSLYNDPTEAMDVTGIVGAKTENEAEEIVAEAFE